jgi:arsenate reductase (thioredoxin)
MTLFDKVKLRNARVLFVCLGNACRSQMAEAFANAYGSDVLDADSAGIRPASRISRTTQKLMLEKQIEISGKEPRKVDVLDLIGVDLIVNLSGYAIPPASAQVISIPVRDPVGKNEQMHREIRDQIEQAVRSLITQLRLARA